MQCQCVSQRCLSLTYSIFCAHTGCHSISYSSSSSITGRPLFHMYKHMHNRSISLISSQLLLPSFSSTTIYLGSAFAFNDNDARTSTHQQFKQNQHQFGWLYAIIFDQNRTMFHFFPHRSASYSILCDKNTRNRAVCVIWNTIKLRQKLYKHSRQK
jgi:hypothetical protein